MTNRRALMTIGLLGIPFDANSSYLRGAALAPAAIREALRCSSSNLWSEDGVDLGAAATFDDAGDLTLPDETAPAFELVEAEVRAALGRSQRLICLGGDHSITYPIIKGFQPRYRELTILHFDAHPDLYDELDGNRLSHACQFARIMEDGLVRRLVQVGIRTLNAHQARQAERFGVEVISMRKLAKVDKLKLEGPLFISFDLDVLDPAFAPGVSHYEPGGMSVRDVLAIIQSLRAELVGADIVEYNPARDRHAQTAMVCAKIFKEIAAAMLRRGADFPVSWP
jgi:arginase